MGISVHELLTFACSVDGQGVVDHQNCTYTSEELLLLACCIIDLPMYSRVVEIGTFCGRSASLYLKAFDDLELDIHLIDNWSWNQNFASHAFVDLVLKNFNEVPFTLHKMLSSRLAREWNQSIDFLHIDGWHDLPGIEPDCQGWLPWVAHGGLAAFHDSDCEPIKYCLDKYVQGTGWTKIGEAERTTVWRKP